MIPEICPRIITPYILNSLATILYGWIYIMKGVILIKKTVTVVDARMGRGKTSAAIRYMKENCSDRRFIFVTPYLSEVERICESCGFEEPVDDLSTKSINLKHKMHKGCNLAITHALFGLMDIEALELARDNHYSLIIDESINIIEKIQTSAKDFNIILENLTTEDEIGRLVWKDPEYQGRFDDYKELSSQGTLFRLDSALLNITNPDIFTMFEEVIMLTYLFSGQTQKAYLDYFEIPYRIVGVEKDDLGFKFSDEPDKPEPIDLSYLINIITKPKMNHPFRGRYSLSKNWFSKRDSSDDDIKLLRRYLNTFFSSTTKSTSDSRIWTCFKDDYSKIVGPKRRYASSFLPMNIRATNEYREATAVAYLVNRFLDPNLMKFFAARGIMIDHDQFALSEMIQFIWRSAIRDNKPIDLYIPSDRMRNLLIDWMNSINSEGEPVNE